MFNLYEFWGLNERLVGSFNTHAEALQKAAEMDLIGESNATFGEEGGFIRYNGQDEIL